MSRLDAIPPDQPINRQGVGQALANPGFQLWSSYFQRVGSSRRGWLTRPRSPTQFQVAHVQTKPLGCAICGLNGTLFGYLSRTLAGAYDRY
jgi:hypothetical protein